MDTAWSKVFGHVKKRGKFINFYLEVEMTNGCKIFRTATITAHEAEVGRIDFYKWVLDGMVRDLEDQLRTRGQ